MHNTFSVNVFTHLSLHRIVCIQGRLGRERREVKRDGREVKREGREELRFSLLLRERGEGNRSYRNDWRRREG